MNHRLKDMNCFRLYQPVHLMHGRFRVFFRLRLLGGRRRPAPRSRIGLMPVFRSLRLNHSRRRFYALAGYIAHDQSRPSARLRRWVVLHGGNQCSRRLSRRHLVAACLNRALQSCDFVLPDLGKLDRLGSQLLYSSLALRKCGGVPARPAVCARRPGRRLRSGFPSRLQTVAESGPSRDRQGAIGYVAS